MASPSRFEVAGVRSRDQLHATLERATARGVAAAFVAVWERRHAIPAHRSAEDERWVASVIAKRAAYYGRIAKELGLDPDEVGRASRNGTLSALLSRGPFAL